MCRLADFGGPTSVHNLLTKRCSASGREAARPGRQEPKDSGDLHAPPSRRTLARPFLGGRTRYLASLAAHDEKAWFEAHRAFDRAIALSEEGPERRYLERERAGLA